VQSLRCDNPTTSKEEETVTYWKYLDPFIEPDLDLLSEADLDLRRDTDLDRRGDADLDLKNYKKFKSISKQLFSIC
jgi:hypothetical protein